MGIEVQHSIVFALAAFAHDFRNNHDEHRLDLRWAPYSAWSSIHIELTLVNLELQVKSTHSLQYTRIHYPHIAVSHEIQHAEDQAESISKFCAEMQQNNCAR